MKTLLVASAAAVILLVALGWDAGVCLIRLERACVWLAKRCRQLRP